MEKLRIMQEERWKAIEIIIFQSLLLAYFSKRERETAQSEKQMDSVERCSVESWRENFYDSTNLFVCESFVT